jgi:hypothetical protein
VKRLVFLLVFGSMFGITFGQTTVVSDSMRIADSIQVADTFLKYKPYYMHTVGIQARTRYAYILEYNFKGIPHAEIKLAGGTADHTHYNLMGYTTTKTTGRYFGFGASIASRNYYKPVKSYKAQHGLVASFVYGVGRLNFSGEKEFKGGIYSSYLSQVIDEQVDYTFTEFRLGYELILDRVIRFDIYPVQFTYHTITSVSKLNHQYIPAIGITKNGHYNPGFGVHIVLNQIKNKKP